jgi:hypothetical protein
MVPDFLLASFQYRAGSEWGLVKCLELVVGVIFMSILTIHMYVSFSIRILKNGSSKDPTRAVAAQVWGDMLEPTRGG